MAGYREALDVAVAAAQAAGELLRRDFLQPGGPAGEGEHAPADEQAEALIRERLLAVAPGWGYRGEETRPHLLAEPDADGHRHLWLVDPNDGTSAYLKGWRGSAVSIGLLCDGVPVLGVVNAFAAPDNDGDLFAWAEGCGPITRNGEALPDRHQTPPYILISQSADRHPAVNLAVLAFRGMASDPENSKLTPNSEQRTANSYISVTSIAYRLALVAAGEGTGCVCLSHPGDWDYGGGHALLRGAGGELVDQTGEPVTYRPDDGASATEWCFGGLEGAGRRLAGLPWQSVVRAPAARADEDALGAAGRLCRPSRGAILADTGLLLRGQGCWLGQLCGDALGSMVEFGGAAAIRRRYPGGLREIGPSPVWRTIAGQPTDDSELALILARILVRDGAYQEEAVAQGYCFWRESEPFDVGNTIGQATQAMVDARRRGESLSEAARRRASRQSEANGALMRQSPLAIWGCGVAPEALAEIVRADTTLTHPNPVCCEASEAFVVALAATIREGLDGPAAHAVACEWQARHGSSPAVTQALERAQEASPHYERNAGHVIIALQNAFHQALHAPLLEEGIVRTVMSGGDTDTNGAIAGALLGAIHGARAVPLQWRQAVLSCRPQAGIPGIEQPRPQPFWPADAQLLAERLLVAGDQRRAL